MKAPPPDCDSGENGPRAGEQTFLVAEDDPAIRNLVRKLLEAKGYRVLCGSNGHEALQASRSFSGKVNLVITDVDMPEMNGIELSRHIRAERPGTPLLIISGRACSSEAPFLAKPFRPFFFYKAIEQAIAAPATIPGTARIHRGND